VGGQYLTSKVLVSAGHPVVPWAKELQEAPPVHQWVASSANLWPSVSMRGCRVCLLPHIRCASTWPSFLLKVQSNQGTGPLLDLTGSYWILLYG